MAHLWTSHYTLWRTHFTLLVKMSQAFWHVQTLHDFAITRQTITVAGVAAISSQHSSDTNHLIIVTERHRRRGHRMWVTAHDAVLSLIYRSCHPQKEDLGFSSCKGRPSTRSLRVVVNEWIKWLRSFVCETKVENVTLNGEKKCVWAISAIVSCISMF